ICPGDPVPPEFTPTEVPGAYVAPSPAADRIQDISSQTIVPLLGLRPGQTFLDVCSAPGNKTAQAIEMPIRAVAGDVSAARLHQVRRLAVPMLALDATKPLPFSAKFDRILVDAPCSGTGTLMRNPEIKWKLRPADIQDLQRQQVAILRNA